MALSWRNVGHNMIRASRCDSVALSFIISQADSKRSAAKILAVEHHICIYFRGILEGKLNVDLFRWRKRLALLPILVAKHNLKGCVVGRFPKHADLSSLLKV